ncbi:hypothetical protein LCGC14_1354350 [marine sediment metagenome]|uniref:Uncharacterized protein n=1 Tax=marine sediment metagenome TaxID=412755 RepID=A0A0F9KW20_9ZZZZ
MKTNGFTTLQNNFIMAYTAFGMDTYANGMLSMIAAGSKAKTDRALTVVASKMLTNIDIKTQIKAIEAVRMAQLAVKTDITAEKIVEMYKEDRDFAHECNQAGACVTATTGIARVCGLEKDGGSDTVTVINVINYAEISPKRVESEVIEDV